MTTGKARFRFDFEAFWGELFRGVRVLTAVAGYGK
jgi:hypothetical protein